MSEPYFSILVIIGICYATNFIYVMIWLFSRMMMFCAPPPGLVLKNLLIPFRVLNFY